MNLTYVKSLTQIIQYIKKFEKAYIFGAGKYSKMLIDSLGETSKEISAVVVTSKEGNPHQIYGIPVLELKKIDAEPINTGFILAIQDELISDVIFTLEKYGYSNVLEIEDIPYLHAGGGV